MKKPKEEPPKQVPPKKSLAELDRKLVAIAFILIALSLALFFTT